MENVQFEENKYQAQAYQNVSGGTSKMADFLVNKGIAKSPEAAEKILIVATIIIFALAIFIAFRTLQGSPTAGTGELLPAEEMMLEGEMIVE